MNQFLLGAAVMGAGIAGLLFLRFWRKTRDRLFLIFAASFWLLGLNWFLLAWLYLIEEKSSLYIVRLFAFLLILVGIIDKNRPRRSSAGLRPGTEQPASTEPATPSPPASAHSPHRP